MQAGVTARNFAPAFPPGHMTACFAEVVWSNYRGGLCASWMWMMCVSMFPSVRLAACVSSCWLRCLRVEIRMFARPCARGMVCDAFGAEAGFSQCRCCAALLCSIVCWYWDSIRRACQACISELSVLPQSEASLGGETERCKKIVFPAAIGEKSRCWVALSYDAHSVSAGLVRIRQPCVWSSSESNLVRTSFKRSPFCAGNLM